MTLTMGGVMKGQTTRTIGTLANGEVTLPLVLKASRGIGCVTAYVREDGRLSAITGRFRTDQTFAHFQSFLKEEVLAEGTRLTLIKDL